MIILGTVLIHFGPVVPAPLEADARLAGILVVLTGVLPRLLD